MDFQNLVLGRDMLAVNPAAQLPQEFVIDGKQPVAVVFERQRQIELAPVVHVQVVLMPVDVDVRCVIVLRVMRKQDADAFEFHQELVAGKREAMLHIIRNRLGIMVAAHENLPARQVHDARELRVVVERDISEVEHRICIRHGLAPVFQDELAEAHRTLSRAFEHEMPNMGISCQIQYDESAPFPS